MTEQPVSYIAHSGSDLLVVNAARVSFNKHKERLDESDVKLIKYLAEHNHWTPFGHPQITLRIRAPIFVRTQLFKHKQGFVENEISRRYVDDPPEFFYPWLGWRQKPSGSVKQGSGKVIEDKWLDDIDRAYAESVKTAGGAYQDLLDLGVCPEQARMVLPQSMITEWYWTGSLAAYARVYNLRTDPHAQKETSDIVKIMGGIIGNLYPVSWQYLTTKKETNV